MGIAQQLEPLGVQLTLSGDTIGRLELKSPDALDDKGRFKPEVVALLQKINPGMSVSFNDGKNEIHDGLLIQLAGMPFVKTIYLHTIQDVSDAGLQAILELPQLQTVFLGGTGPSKITPAGLAKLAALPKLKTLLIAIPVDESIFASIPEHSSLETVTLSRGSNVTDAGLGKVKALPALSDLSISYSGINGSGLAFLKGSPKLRTLNLDYDRNLTDAGFAAIEKAPNLSRLTVLASDDNLNLTDKTLESLATLPKLRNLWLRKTPGITDAGVAHLAGLASLTEVRLDDCAQLTNASLDSLAKIATLEHLEISGALKITDAGLDKLKPLAKLRSLHFKMTGVTKAGAKLFNEAGKNMLLVSVNGELLTTR